MIRQQQALLATEGVQIEFTDAAIREIAKVAEEVSIATYGGFATNIAVQSRLA